MLTKRVWRNVQEIGTRESSFDWDIPSGYILFGQVGMSVHKLIKGIWYTKHVNNWRKLDVAEVNLALKEQSWERKDQES